MRKPTLGSTIAKLRKEHKMTQIQLAELMNVTDKAVSKWERDLSTPDINSISKLSEIFNVSIDHLIQSKSEPDNISIFEKINTILDTVFKSIPLAMGIAVTTLASLKELSLENGFILLGIGLASLSISNLRNK